MEPLYPQIRDCHRRWSGIGRASAMTVAAEGGRWSRRTARPRFTYRSGPSARRADQTRTWKWTQGRVGCAELVEFAQKDLGRLEWS